MDYFSNDVLTQSQEVYNQAQSQDLGNLTESGSQSSHPLTSSQSSHSLYSPSSEELSSSYDCSQNDALTHHIEAPKAVVFISCLLQLFTTCQVQECHSAIDQSNIRIQEVGAAIVVKYECNNNHSGEWSSSPFIGEGKAKSSVLNVLIANFILTCGLSVSKVLDFFSHMKMYMFGKSYFYNIKSKVLDKVIWMTWSDCQKTEIECLKRRQV